MILYPDAHIDDNLINAFPCPIKLSNEQIAWLHKMKGTKSELIKIGCKPDTLPVAESIRDYECHLSIPACGAAKHIEKGN